MLLKTADIVPLKIYKPSTCFHGLNTTAVRKAQGCFDNATKQLVILFEEKGLFPEIEQHIVMPHYDRNQEAYPDHWISTAEIMQSCNY